MARKVFFSFHYQDVIDLRANVVRNHWVTKPDREAAGYFDSSIWESAKKQGDVSLKRLINGGLDGTTNTCVLVGTQTYARPWVRYEILKSYIRGNHLLAVHINSIKGSDKKTKPNGKNPFDFVGVTFSSDGKTGTLKEWNGKEWVDYSKIDGTPRFATNVDATKRGKGLKLSGLFDIHDWMGDDGYNKFSSWLS
ncbi:MAG TPA: TIR domain-containing protein [Candidatus Sulfotelmatobacter sp.]|nr:TIR domain-containing protein [Candidatus Sulfotelmatobacter sp.]